MTPFFFFDFTLDKSAMPPVVTVPESPCPKVPFEQNNLCPYPIPKTDEIVKDIERAAYQVDTFKFVSDLFECGAIAISNQVDHFNRDEREERYMQIIKTYQPDQQKSLAEIFAKIYALLSSVVYDNGVFNDYLGEIFMRCNLGSKARDSFLRRIMFRNLWQEPLWMNRSFGKRPIRMRLYRSTIPLAAEAGC